MLSGESQGWLWPESLDALVAEPAHHRQLFENEQVRVLEVASFPLKSFRYTLIDGPA
jgi:hypothetical protein